MPVSAPSDKRFRRAHVAPVRRQRWLPPWRRVLSVGLLVGVLGFGLYRAAGLAAAAESLTITRITVTGANRMSAGEVLALLDELRGQNMVTTNLEAWRRKLLASPWIADAAMRRVFPGTLSVVVSEREPLGIGRIGDALYLIDRRGAIIDEFGPTYAEFDLPIIDGLAAAPGGSGALVDERRAALAGRLLSELQRRPDLGQRVSQVDVSDVRDAAVILKDDTALIRVGDDRFVERVQAYLDLSPRLREQVPQIDYVDMRFDERVYVRPQQTAPGRPPRAGQRRR
jgi:cell division septal protein FtsQ